MLKMKNVRPRRRFAPALEGVESRTLLSTPGVGSGSIVRIQATIRTEIGVGTPVGPYLVHPTSPSRLDIFVASRRLPNGRVFRPLAEIDPTLIVVNGVSFPTAAIGSAGRDLNRDGVLDAVVTIQPRSALRLTPFTRTLTIGGRLRNGLDAFTGSAPITVSTRPSLGTNVLLPGEQLDFSNPTRFSNALISQNQQFILILQTTDSNLTIYPFNPVTRQPITTRPIWTANFANRNASQVIMQSTDGNLVAYTPGQVAVWSTGTSSPGNVGAVAILTNDGRLQVIKNGVLLFSSG